MEKIGHNGYIMNKEVEMSEIMEKVRPETKKSAESFIRRIQNGTYQREVLPNSGEEFPVNKALESARDYLQSDLFKKLS